MDKRLKQLIEKVEEGNEEAASDIAKEFPKQYEKIFGIPMPKLVEKRHGGMIENKANKKMRPQGVRAAKKGFGKAYLT
jgi:NADH:ubiquinone oxidoreductase subunit F (NADH-binding)